MITIQGRTHIKRFLAKYVPSIGESVAFGIGSKAESDTDTRLQFEVGRSTISLLSYDFTNNRLVFKAPVDTDLSGSIYEVALFSSDANTGAGEFGSRILSFFDSSLESWIDATALTPASFTTLNSRIGPDSLRQAPATGVTKVDALKDIVLDLSGYSAADRFVVACNSGNAFASSVRLMMLTDSSNYYEVNFGAATSGYNILEVAKGSAVATGSPSWANITEIRVKTIAAGGTAQVDFDGIRIEDTDTVNADYVMVSRELLSSPYAKKEGTTQEIEFSLNINIP